MNETKNVVIEIPATNWRQAVIKLIGETPLITNPFSEKAKRQIEEKQAKVAKKPLPARDPKAEFEAAQYHMNGKGSPHAIPAIWLKKAMVAACRDIPDLSMVRANSLFQTTGELWEMKSDDPIMRSDWVTIGRGTRDMRYRPEYKNWSVDAHVLYNADVLSLQQILNLASLAGRLGFGEMRPSKTGYSYGMFTIETSDNGAESSKP